MKSKITSNILLFLAAIIWGFAFVAQVEGSNFIGSFTMTGFRFAIGVLSLIPVILIFERGKTNKKEQKYTVLASVVTGAVMFVAISLQQFGISITQSAGVSSFITGLYMIFVPFTYFAFFKRKIGMQVWFGALVAVVGIFLLCIDPRKGFSFGLGELLLLISAFAWTAHIMLVDHFSKRTRSLHFSFGQFSVCAVIALICAFVFEDVTVPSLWAARIPLLYTGVLSVGVAFTLQVVGQKNADPNYAVLILSTESVFGAIGGAIFGNDKIPFVGYIGCALMFVGIICAQVDFKALLKKDKEKNPQPLKNTEK